MLLSVKLILDILIRPKRLKPTEKIKLQWLRFSMSLGGTDLHSMQKWTLGKLSYN